MSPTCPARVRCSDTADPTFERLDEETDLRRRAQMLDEALEILTRAWSGQPFSYAGQFFRVRDVTMSLKPVQQPRIPIWIGGQWPRRGPVTRMLRWDGFCPYKTGPGEPWQDLTPDDVRAIRAAADGRSGGRVVRHFSWRQAQASGLGRGSRAHLVHCTGRGGVVDRMGTD